MATSSSPPHFPAAPTGLAPTVMVGDISLGVEASIAPGVLIHVAPGSRLVVEAGACIASDTVIRVYGGTLHLGAGCQVGGGVVLLGRGTVGAQACIGAGSTLVNPAVATQGVVAAGMWQWNKTLEAPGVTPGASGLLWDCFEENPPDQGDEGNTGANNTRKTLREKEAESFSRPDGQHSVAHGTGPSSDTPGASPARVPSSPEATQSNPPVDPPEAPSKVSPESAPDPPPEIPLATHTVIYGREQVLQLIQTLFPHRQNLSPPP